METILVAVGSTRSPKLKAVSAALESFGALLSPEAKFEVIGVPAPSGVGHTPVGRAQILAGARGRVEELMQLARAREEHWRYFVGLEGGLEIVGESSLDQRSEKTRIQLEERGTPSERGGRLVLLENWAFVSDGEGREAFGHAGGVLLPGPLVAEVLDRGVELAAAIDAYAGGRGIRDAQGAWGVLTRGLISRQESYRAAVIHAFAPFYNAPIYR